MWLWRCCCCSCCCCCCCCSCCCCCCCSCCCCCWGGVAAAAVLLGPASAACWYSSGCCRGAATTTAVTVAPAPRPNLPLPLAPALLRPPLRPPSPPAPPPSRPSSLFATTPHQVELKVNKLTSVHTQLPYDYYTVKFCEPHGGVQQVSQQLLELLCPAARLNSPHNRAGPAPPFSPAGIGEPRRVPDRRSY